MVGTALTLLVAFAFGGLGAAGVGWRPRLTLGILAAVGQLQFDVVQYRLESEYGAKTTVQRLPFISSYVRNKFLASTPVPEDIATAWRKLSNVTIEGNTLKLAMQ